ncbi:MAG: cupin domain-containing protein [Parvibaculaceae bacterium]
MTNDSIQGIEAITRIGPEPARAHVPPLSDYASASPEWKEVEYRFFEGLDASLTGGYWTGEAGKVSFEAWPYTEMCSILSGRVALCDTRGQKLEFGPGDGFIVPKGWAGSWITLERTSKIFLAID